MGASPVGLEGISSSPAGLETAGDGEVSAGVEKVDTPVGGVVL